MSIQPGQVTPAMPELQSYVQTTPDLTRENLLDVEEVARRLNVTLSG